MILVTWSDPTIKFAPETYTSARCTGERIILPLNATLLNFGPMAIILYLISLSPIGSYYMYIYIVQYSQIKNE